MVQAFPGVWITLCRRGGSAALAKLSVDGQGIKSQLVETAAEAEGFRMGEAFPFRYPPSGGVRLQGLTAFLYGLDQERVVISFDELERATGCRLNATLRQHQSAWSNSSSYARYWKDTDYRPSFAGVNQGHIAFVRQE